jgi:O-acetyl-ADP-ribose deacetylase (regulator of RNase III)
VIKQDILKIERGVICHQVNCQGVMGAGLALAVRQKWPSVFRAYKNSKLRLGDCLIEEAGLHLYVANLAGQDRYGRDKQYTDYYALAAALKQADNFAEEQELQLYVPYKMGCTLGGGNWQEVTKIIETLTPKAIICQHFI